jgi:hypothetical protein
LQNCRDSPFGLRVERRTQAAVWQNKSALLGPLPIFLVDFRKTGEAMVDWIRDAEMKNDGPGENLG